MEAAKNDRYKYSNTKCNYFHQKFCKFRKYFLPGVVAFEDFRKASSLISAVKISWDYSCRIYAAARSASAYMLDVHTAVIQGSFSCKESS